MGERERVCVCVCVRERERERERSKEIKFAHIKKAIHFLQAEGLSKNSFRTISFTERPTL